MHQHYPVAIHLFFIKNDQILLLRRANTGWEDGNYSVPAGHLEANETATEAAVREAYEETGVTLKPDDLEVIHTMHRKSIQERFDLFFLVKHWSPEPFNNEPEKCDDLKWYDLNSLPDNTIPYIRESLENYHKGLIFSEFAWE